MRGKKILITIFCIFLVSSFPLYASATCNDLYPWEWAQSTNGLWVKDHTDSSFPSVIEATWYAWNAIDPNVSLAFTTSTSSEDADINLFDESIPGDAWAQTWVYREYPSFIVDINSFVGYVSKANIIFDNKTGPDNFVNLSYTNRCKITRHELGHALGLNHPTCNYTAVMHQGYPGGIVSSTVTSHDMLNLNNKW